MEQTTVTVDATDGVIDHLHYDAHKRSKSWVARVRRDRSAPGGLQRHFLERAASGKGRVQLGPITAGDWLEFAADYYTTSGRKQQNRHYYRVSTFTAENGHRLVLEPCDLDDVGKADTNEVDELRTGRPPIGPSVTLRLPADLLERIDAAADKEGITRSAAVRGALAAVFLAD